MFFYSDKSGSGGLTQSSFKISAAYHWAMNKKGNNILFRSLTRQALYNMKSRSSKLTFEDQLVGNLNESVDLANIDKMKKGFLDHVGGLKFTSKLNKTDNLPSVLPPR